MSAGERLRNLRKEKGLSTPQLAERVGKSESAVRNQENGTNGIPPGLAAKYARVLGTTAAYLLYGDETARPADERIVPSFLQTRYKVQAGLWYEVDQYAQDYPAPPQPVAPDPRYADWPQWMELVEGDSIDRIITEGSFAHVVDAIEMGYAPQHGDLVVVERRRNGGMLRERTIKEVAINGNGVELWPRSHNEKWSAPITLASLDDEVEVEIVGVVIGSYRSLRQ